MPGFVMMGKRIAKDRSMDNKTKNSHNQTVAIFSLRFNECYSCFS